MPASSGDDPGDPRLSRRDPAIHAEWRFLDPAKREPSGHDSCERNADQRQHDVDRVQREFALGEGRSRERHVVEQRSKDEEECEADCDARNRRGHCLHRGERGDLSRRGADEAHGGVALLASRRRQSAHGANVGTQDDLDLPVWRGARAAESDSLLMN